MIVPLRAAPFSVTVIVSVRAVGTSAALTVKVAELPLIVTVPGPDNPVPPYVMPAVCAKGSDADSVTVTVAEPGVIRLDGLAAMVVIDGGDTVSVT